MISAEKWLQAETETKFHRSQIQGFLYGPDFHEGRGDHVVRDCTKPPEDQRIWSEHDPTGERYDVLRAEAYRVIKLERIRIIANRYAQLI